MENTLELILDTGLVDIELKDTKGNEIGTFSFNPTDIDIVKRFQESIKRLEEISIPDKANYYDILNASEEIKKEFDYILNANCSQAIFGKLNPLTSVGNGDYYFEIVLEKIGGVIEKTLDKRLEKKRAKIKKYTDKYK